MGHLQRAAHMTGIQHKNLSVVQIGRALVRQGPVSVCGGGYHDDIHILHSGLQIRGHQLRRPLAFYFSGDHNLPKRIQFVDFRLVNVVQFDGISLAAQYSSHGLPTGTCSQHCKIQTHTNPPFFVCIYELMHI